MSTSRIATIAIANPESIDKVSFNMASFCSRLLQPLFEKQCLWSPIHSGVDKICLWAESLFVHIISIDVGMSYAAVIGLADPSRVY